MTSKGPTDHIRTLHQQARDSLPFDDETDIDNAQRGFLRRLDPCVVRDADGRTVWDNDSYRFLEQDTLDSVHPSLLRQSRLTAMHGLYEVIDGIYQVRGLDMSNITFVESDTGVVVIDPLISIETARAAMDLYRAERGDRAVRAVIYTHSHLDHFGGTGGVVTAEDVDSGRVPIIAPEGFTEHAVAENLYAGVAMSRRAGYMYGGFLPPGPRGQVGMGLGQTGSTGTSTLFTPTVSITTTGQSHTVDGLQIDFQMAPGTEAPAEMHFYFPRYRALCMAENATHTLHNLVTLRGAQVRDAHDWARYLSEAIKLYATRTDVLFASHHWPTWGRDNIVEFLDIQRDLYAYQHDQTLHMMNQGLTGAEIAEQFTLPPRLERAWSARGYYGSISHNVKAIYQRYMGWFDGNPTRLWQHTPTNAATRYVDAMGGHDAVLAQARTAAATGDFRWAATLLDHAVFARPDNEPARRQLADVLEQLGYGAENGTWRNFFLSGAAELRHGNLSRPTSVLSDAGHVQLTPPMFFAGVAIQIDGPRAWTSTSPSTGSSPTTPAITSPP